MQVLVEFTYDLECQISVVCPIILQEIYRIFQSEQVKKQQLVTQHLIDDDIKFTS